LLDGNTPACYNRLRISQLQSATGASRAYSRVPHNVMRYKVTSLIRADVGARLQIAIDEPQRRLSPDLEVDYVRGNLVLTRTDQHILVTGPVKAATTSECVRCLDSFHQPLQFQLEELFALKPSPQVTDRRYIVASDGTIDLKPPLREQILLSQPLNPICRPDCKGLCASCGKNLNEGPCECQDESIDPRLAALKALL